MHNSKASKTIDFFVGLASWPPLLRSPLPHTPKKEAHVNERNANEVILSRLMSTRAQLQTFEKFIKNHWFFVGLAYWAPHVGSLWTPPVGLKCAPVLFRPVQCLRIPGGEFDSSGHTPN